MAYKLKCPYCATENDAQYLSKMVRGKGQWNKIRCINCGKSFQAIQAGSVERVEGSSTRQDRPELDRPWTSARKPLINIAEWSLGLKLLLLVIVVIVLIGAAVALTYHPKHAHIELVNVDFKYNYFSDTVHVWGTVKNTGNGYTDDWHVITVYFTIWFDGEPYTHEYWIWDPLGPGESASFEQTYDVPFTLNPNVSVDVHVTSITWYNAP